jgi:HAD superfamily hydrolase (TIGR01509 family)
MAYRGLLFDVDGVLVESEKARFAFLQARFGEKGIVLPEETFSAVIGKSTPVVIREMCSRHHSSDLEAEMLKEFTVFKRIYLQHFELISMTTEFIKNYGGQSKLGIATSNSRETTVKLLQFLHLHTKVDGVVTRDDVLQQKPDPEAYVKLAELLSLEAKECVVIEDTMVGARAAIGAGMDVYILLNSYNNREQFEGVDIKGFISSEVELRTLAL